MKLWYAVMFRKEGAGVEEDAVFLVRAKNPASCDALADRRRSLVSPNTEPFVTAALELGKDESGSKVESVVAGPFSVDDSFALFGHEYTYWRRDFPDDDWVNFTKFREADDYFSCVYDEDR